ncbi:MAG TPA: hypothetical protein VE093_39490 [Polyangiaceae bacterium]|jgi:hypothetical protein|nr:hypothetical protein [Polyangiaceae bacterium]
MKHMTLAILRSNDGESELMLQFEAHATYATEPGFEASIRLQGQHWDGDHTHKLAVTIENLWLRAQDLLRLQETLADWLGRPMHQLDPTDLDGEFQLACLPGQSVALRFGARREVSAGRNPIVTVAFAAGALMGEFHFFTDQSCLELFRRDLSAALQSSG